MDDLFDDSDNSDIDDSNDDDMEMNTDLSSELCRQQLLSRRPRTCGVMAFHNGTEEALFLFIQRNAEKGNAASILKAIDVFCYSRHWMMHCGDQKAQYLQRALFLGKDRSYCNSMKSTDKSGETHRKSSRGLICLEIGSYCGYSAIKIASLFDPSDDDFLYCIGKHAKYQS